LRKYLHDSAKVVRITEETDACGAFDNARDVAAHAEERGYRRI
jgi:hypothetical protein